MIPEHAELMAKGYDIKGMIKEIDEKLSDPDVWSDHKKSDKLGKERAKLVADLEPLEFEWMSRAEA